MVPHEIVARRRCPAAFMGMGGLKWYGEHQAVGLDPRTRASPELGRKSMGMIVEAMVCKSRELLAESGFSDSGGKSRF